MLTVGLLVALLFQAAGGAASERASISGRVTDKASGQPLQRIVVSVYSADRAKQAEILTDKEGRYQFTGLKPGKYTVGADNDDHVATYLQQWFGADEPAAIFTVPPPPNVEIGSGEARADIDLAMMRALAIEGHVFDPQGEPLRDVEVSAVYADGRTLGVRGAMTDDLGAYRVYGLPPGRYRVCGLTSAGGNVHAAADRAPLGRTCYPDLTVTSQDNFNIDIHMQPRSAAAPTPDAVPAVPAAAPNESGTGTIRGVVIDKQSGRPIPRAIVRLGFHGPAQSPVDLTAGTNGDGVFVFRGLAAGEYDGFAQASGHVQALLMDQNNSWRLTIPKDGVVQVSAALQRAYAITVRVVDAFDMPLTGIGVSGFGLDGRPASSRYQYSTDDLGRVRLPDVPPGRYLICAESLDYLTASRSVAQPRPNRLLRTCYPSAPSDGEAQPVTLGDGDMDGVEIRMLRGRTVSISGTIIDASGAPARTALVQFVKYMPTGMTATSVDVRPNGEFRVNNVQPGAYAIQATGDGEAAFVPIRFDEADIEHLAVTMRKTTAVAGRIIPDDPSAALPNTPGRAPVTLTARLADDRLPGGSSGSHTTANSDGTFTLTDLFGVRRLDVQNVPAGWYVKAIRYGTKDVTDQPIEFRDDRGALEIVLSNRGAMLSGTIANVIDKRVPRARVLLFRAQANQDDTPRLAGSLTSTTGNYEFGPLRQGDYFIVAVSSDMPIPISGDWDRLARLAAAGERVTVIELEERRVDLHIVDIR